MFLSNPAKSFLACVIVFCSTAACGLLRSEDPTEPIAEQPKNRFPFSTKEPDNFQCEIVESAGESVRRKRLAKKGALRRIDFDFRESGQRAVLQTDKEYLLDIGRGIYAERPAVPTSGEAQFSELTHELLNIGQPSAFDETGRDGPMVTYVVRPAGSGASEVIVRYDESIGMPVKQEFYSTGAKRILHFTVEIVNCKLEPDTDVFSVPDGFRKVSMNEFLGGGSR